MIDWGNVFFHACWIMGCALLLSEYSYYSWESKAGLVASKKRKKQQIMSQFVAQLMVVFGLALVSQGWQQLLWIVLGILAVVQLYVELRESK